MFEIEAAMRTLVERGGSDLHIKVGSPAMARVSGQLGPLVEGDEPLGPADTEAAFEAIAGEKVRAEFEAEGEADFAHAIPQVGRFRINAFRQRGSVSIATPVASETAAAVSWQRSSGLLTIAASGTPVSRSAARAACALPRSSRWTPGVRPASTGPVIAVRPCRSSRTVVTIRQDLGGVPTTPVFSWCWYAA